MKRTYRTLIACGLVLIVGLALAARNPLQLEIDDGNFDYYDTENAYVTFERQGDTLMAIFSAEETEGSFTLDFDEIDRPDEDIDEDDLPEVEYLREHAGVDSERRELEFVFEGDMDEVVEQLTARLEELGFTLTEQDTGTVNVAVYECTAADSEGNFRLVFHRLGEDVVTRIRA